MGLDALILFCVCVAQAYQPLPQVANSHELSGIFKDVPVTVILYFILCLCSFDMILSDQILGNGQGSHMLWKSWKSLKKKFHAWKNHEI